MKTALVTGGTSGIGLEVTKILMARNYQVLVICRKPRTKSELEGLFGKSPPLVISRDLAEIDSYDQVVEAVTSQLNNRLDLLFSNAGYGLFGLLEKMTTQEIVSQLNTNLLSSIELTRRLIPLLKQSQGQIIQTSSVMGFFGSPLGSIYTASKYAIEGFMESIRYELAPYNVRVSIVCPSSIKTNFAANLKGPLAGDTHWQSKNFHLFQKKIQTNSKRLPEKVAQKIAMILDNPNPRFRLIIGLDGHLTFHLRRFLSTNLFVKMMNRFFQGNINKKIEVNYENC